MKTNAGEKALTSRDAFLGLNHRKEAGSSNTPLREAETTFPLLRGSDIQEGEISGKTCMTIGHNFWKG